MLKTSSRRIQGGKSARLRAGSASEDAKHFVLILSRGAPTSCWIKREWERWKALLLVLRSDRRTKRAPYMPGDLPADFRRCCTAPAATERRSW